MSYNCIVLLGPTAVGKTSLGVRLADRLNTHIISADSRQVYRGLDLGSGKDIGEYEFNGKQIPYHLIDVTDLSCEYNVFCYQKDFYKVFSELSENNIVPVVVGGTGMYVDAVIRGYEMPDVPENKELRNELEKKSLEQLGEILLSLKPALHNKSDLLIRDRVVRAIEIAMFMKSPEYEKKKAELNMRPDIRPVVIGTTIERTLLRQNIKKRLDERFKLGMIEEVEGLHKNGADWERLERLGLEYRFISEYLEGKIPSKEELSEKLYTAICQFAKRQETWFRGMEKKGVVINWLPKTPDIEERLCAALKILEEHKA